MRIINTWRDPYNAGFSPTRPKQITIYPGLTVLVGCNGAGKTTLLRNIKSELRQADVPCHMFDNLHDGGGDSMFGLGAYVGGFSDGDLSTGLSLFTSSEGEQIRLNVGLQSQKYKEFLETGFYNNKENRLARLFKEEEDKKPPETKERWLLFDAVDSGMSIDAVIEIKVLFDAIIEDAKQMGIECYIVIAANEYELAHGTECFDVNKGEYICFDDYDDFKKFILESRKKKEKRYIQQAKWQEKQKIKAEKERKVREEKYNAKIKEIEDKAKAENRPLSWSDRHWIDEYKSKIEKGY